MPARSTGQNGDSRLPTWSPTLIASRPCCAVVPTSAAARVVTKPWTTHCPPLDGMKIATIELAAAVRNVNVSGVDQAANAPARSEEHTSELQSRLHLVCRLL